MGTESDTHLNHAKVGSLVHNVISKRIAQMIEKPKNGYVKVAYTNKRGERIEPLWSTKNVGCHRK